MSVPINVIETPAIFCCFPCIHCWFSKRELLWTICGLRFVNRENYGTQRWGDRRMSAAAILRLFTIILTWSIMNVCKHKTLTYPDLFDADNLQIDRQIVCVKHWKKFPERKKSVHTLFDMSPLAHSTLLVMWFLVCKPLNLHQLYRESDNTS